MARYRKVVKFILSVKNKIILKSGEVIIMYYLQSEIERIYQFKRLIIIFILRINDLYTKKQVSDRSIYTFKCLLKTTSMQVL